MEKRELSKFVTEAIEKASEEKKNNLKAAFKEAENDPDLKETMYQVDKALKIALSLT